MHAKDVIGWGLTGLGLLFGYWKDIQIRRMTRSEEERRLAEERSKALEQQHKDAEFAEAKFDTDLLKDAARMTSEFYNSELARIAGERDRSQARCEDLEQKLRQCREERDNK